METKINKSKARGRTKIEWLDSKHGFSFGQYYNPENTNFKSLIVFNDDIVSQGRGFSNHFHENAEIITIVLEGSLKHEDSLGNKRIINKGEIQIISAGSGIYHSEYNNSKRDEVHFLQIWIQPETLNLKPNYQQFTPLIRINRLNKIISSDQTEDVLQINQDADLFLGKISKRETVNHTLKKNKDIYLFIIKGSISMNQTTLSQGDSAEITSTRMISLNGIKERLVLLIEL